MYIMPRIIINDILAGTHLHNPGPAQTDPTNNPRFAVPRIPAGQARSIVQDHGDLIASLLARIEQLENRVKRLEQAQNNEVEPRPEPDQPAPAQPQDEVLVSEDNDDYIGPLLYISGMEEFEDLSNRTEQVTNMSDIDDVSSGDRYGDVEVEFTPSGTPEDNPVEPPGPRISPIGSAESTPPINLLQINEL